MADRKVESGRGQTAETGYCEPAAYGDQAYIQKGRGVESFEEQSGNFGQKVFGNKRADTVSDIS
jgi:hypothetical protein